MALKHGAVILTPDYRLCPDHELTDALDDIRSFWQWIEQGGAQQVVHKSYPDLHLDVNNLLVGGESAGGYLTVQTALLALTKLPISILFVQYPAVDLASCIKPPDPDGDEMPGAWTHPYPYLIVEEYLAALEPGKICTRAKFDSRMPLHFAMIQASRFVDISGDRAWLDPMSSLDTAGQLPPILLYQSREDEAVSTRAFEEARLMEDMQRYHGSTPNVGLLKLRNYSRMYLYISLGKPGIMCLTATIPWQPRGLRSLWSLSRNTGQLKDSVWGIFGLWSCEALSL